MLIAEHIIASPLSTATRSRGHLPLSHLGDESVIRLTQSRVLPFFVILRCVFVSCVSCLVPVSRAFSL